MQAGRKGAMSSGKSGGIKPHRNEGKEENRGEKNVLINTKMKGNFLKIKKQKCKERLSSA